MVLAGAVPADQPVTDTSHLDSRNAIPMVAQASADSGVHSSRHNERARTIAAVICVILIALCFLGGGASRGDVLSLLYLRPAAVLAIAALLVLPIDRDWRTYRSLLVMLAAFAAIVALQ